ncbi:MAG: PucR family transcriptional regulator [Gulosibacter sp.]|uniref:PucR family transcriptional regulator n=1 Tax=Gulosibacter sp. TaxID=2817531 RepID=UPI003F92CE3F
MTVGDLIAMQQLGCEAIAGQDGWGAAISWAHVCELPDPWNWLAPGELLMTTGMCIPADTAKQVDFVGHMSRSGVPGMIIGDDQKAPPLSAAMLETADAADFPILLMSHAVPFTAIARTVAAADQHDHFSRQARLSRLYEVARSATDFESALLDRLSGELGLRLHIVDVQYRTDIMRGEHQLAEEIRTALCDEVAGKLERLPARIAIDVDEKRAATAFSIASRRPCMLVLESDQDVVLDAFVLLHVQNMVGVEVDRLTQQRELEDDKRESLFLQLIDGAIGADAATPRLEEADLAGTEWSVVGCSSLELAAHRTILGDARIPLLACVLADEGFVLVATASLTAVTEAIGSVATHLGVSSPTSAVQNIPDAVRQARWALDTARSSRLPVAEYSTAAPLFLPRTISEVHLATRTVLGELLDYDGAHDASLIATLEAYLSEDRSWTKTAATLQIHRQTLAYRLKKIETLTGRSTKSSRDIAMFWMALKALRIGQSGII